MTSPDTALLWLGPIRLAMAALFMYLYGRTIGLERWGSLVSALVFSFGGFTVAQLHHINLSNGMLWLPLILLFVERAFRRRGSARLRAVVLAGIAFAVQGLALHVQVSLMTALFLVFYVAFRSLAFPAQDAGRPDAASMDGKPRLSGTNLWPRIRLAVTTLAGTVGLGLGLVAVQWIPLYELSRFSPRAPGLLYSQAQEYALPPVDLITLISPYFFRGPDRVSWAVWSSWETAIYVGIAPLLLAGVALLWGRSRWTAFFGGIGLLSLLTAMANYLPLNLQYLLYRLPWFDALRAPGRFSYLFSFSVACLAGFGASWLVSHRDGLRPRLFTLLPVGLAGIVITTVGLLQWLRGWLLANQAAATDLLGSFYMGLGPLATTRLRKGDVYSLLLGATDLRNWCGPVGLTLASAALLLAWNFRPHWRRAAVAGLALLVAADLFWFAQDFHPTLPVSKVAEVTPLADFLKTHNAGGRAFNLRTTAAEPNRLAPFQVQAAGGYSSLPFTRHSQYASASGILEGPLLDLWNVRYLVTTSLPWGESYKGVTYDPGLPLFDSARQGDRERLPYDIPDVKTSEVMLVSTLRQGATIPQGTALGNIVLTDSSGVQQRVPILAGIHTADAAYDHADVRPVAQHQKPDVAGTLQEPGPDGNTTLDNLYFASIALPHAAAVREVSIEYTYTSGSLEVYGLSLTGDGGPAYQVRPFYTAKYAPVYQDKDSVIYENQDTLPRAFLVPRAISVASGAEALALLSRPDFDPLAELILEEPVDAPQGSQNHATGQAAITEYGDQRVVVQTDSNEPDFLFLSDSYYPGWRAYVDGQEARLYRADFLFRAVPVPAGRHTVEFRYEPESLALGAAVSAIAAAAAILALVASWAAARRALARVRLVRSHESAE